MFTCPYHMGLFKEEINILLCRPVGELTADLAHDIAICRECIIKAGLEHVNRFHDLTMISGINLKYDDIDKIRQVETDFREPQHLVKACYLVKNPITYGTIRMYQAIIEGEGVEVHVSYDIDELAKELDVAPAELSIE